MRSACVAAVLTCLASSPALSSGGEDKLLNQIRLGLLSEGIETNLAALSLSQRVELYLELTSSDEGPGGEIRTRHNLISILNRNPETEPTRR